MTMLDDPALRYYRHSGNLDFGATAAALAAATAAQVVLGFVYAYVDLYSPFVKLSVIVTALAAAGNGVMIGALLKKARLRNAPLAVTIALLSTLFLLWVTWMVYLYALLQRENQAVGLLYFPMHPLHAWEFVQQINAVGAWQMNHSTPTGMELWTIWTGEAGIFLIVSMVLVHSAITKFPFCEQCRAWGSARDLITLHPGDAEKTKAALEQKDFGVLATLGKHRPLESPGRFYQLSLQGCSTCDTTQTLCLDSVTVTVDKKGNEKKKVKHILWRLRLSPEETVAVASGVAGL